VKRCQAPLTCTAASLCNTRQHSHMQELGGDGVHKKKNGLEIKRERYFRLCWRASQCECEGERFRVPRGLVHRPLDGTQNRD